MTWLLAIGGSDSSGGAGLVADADACHVELRTVVTAATQQTDDAVQDTGARDPDAWLFEALSAMAVENPGAIKFGLLPGPGHVRSALAVIDQVRFEDPALPFVVDPVLVSSSGHEFLRAEDSRPLLERPVILTPNLPETAALTGAPLELLASDRGARLAAAQALLQRGLRAVVIKGGHAADGEASDLLLAPGEPPVWISRARIPGPGIRGSGCRFATALAAHLAQGAGLPEAAAAAADLVAERIADSRR